jgi:hypothetical protein
MKQLLMCAFIFTSCMVVNVARANDISGEWELVSGEYTNAKGELIDYQELNMKSLKIVTDSHFSFISMKGNEFWASGAGTYEFKDGKYTEKLGYNSFKAVPGSVFTFTSKVQGGFWYNARWEGEKRVEYEVWQRVK